MESVEISQFIMQAKNEEEHIPVSSSSNQNKDVVDIL